VRLTAACNADDLPPSAVFAAPASWRLAVNGVFPGTTTPEDRPSTVAAEGVLPMLIVEMAH
jgi:hypothetical protein